MILKFRNNSLPVGYFQRFEFDTELIKLKPKEEYTAGTWNGESYDIQVELWQRCHISIPVTEAEAEELYTIRAANEIYIDDVRFELSEITDREALGTTEFRRLTITFTAYNSTIENFTSLTSGYEIGIGSNSWYTNLYISEVESEQEKVNWLRDAQVKFVTKKEIDFFRFYVSETEAQTIKDDIFSETIEITYPTTPSPTTYTPIYVESLNIKEVANDLYEVDIKFVKDEIQEVPDSTFELYLYHENTDNVPSTWTTDRGALDIIKVGSIFEPIRGFEKEDEESEITSRRLVESVKFKDKLSWLTIHTDEVEAFKVQKYFNLVDSVVIIEPENFVAAEGNGISIFPTSGGTATSYDEVLLPGMKFIVDSVTYTVTSVQADPKVAFITPTPASILTEQSYEVQKRFVCKYAEIGYTKNDKGIVELDYDIVINEDIFYPYA